MAVSNVIDQAPRRVYTVRNAARLLGLTMADLRALRAAGEGPPFVVHSDKTLYPRGEFLAWMRALPRTPEGFPAIQRAPAQAAGGVSHV